ncbi:pentatricopeptide repeat-containing protein At2g17033 [Salvia miltiorrhiza]|uniref:pentatricopeptide repeat-containing protein At2g17033 n=1 Tax=Salvia miltiorrhiza TaxID=226208 RepID=UPI0025ACB153|nr:pentatricopeptide repeat-containing protein At2g17033 [Salvia miltiorrhiza]
MFAGGGLHLAAPPPTSPGFRHYRQSVRCALTKQGQRFLSSLAAAEEPSTAASLLRKFAASSSKHVALTTLSHLLSVSDSHPRLSSLAFPLYTAIEQESWFSWNAKLAADVIAFLYKEGRFKEAEDLFAETVLKLGFKERDLCAFYCNLMDSNAKHKSERGFVDSCGELRRLMARSGAVYTKQRGYSAMAAGFCEMGYPEKAENVVEEMVENGVRVMAFELRSLVNGYGRKGLLEDMKRSIVRMEKEGFEMDTVCCNMVLSSFGAHGEIQEMVSWLKKMRGLGIELSVRTYNSVLNSCPSIIFLLKDMKSVPLSIDELVDGLEAEEAGLVLELLSSTVLDQVMECSQSELKLDLHGMHLSTTYLVLLQWFRELKLRFVAGDCATPAEVLVVCGRGKHSSARGESPVRDLAKEIIVRTKCPLRIDRKNVGCFIAKGKTFKDWLLHIL